jgi:hypothetical protein
MHHSSVAQRLRNRIGRFSADLSKGLCVAGQRFVSEMVYGIQASQSVMLTEIGRTLEERVPLRKTQWRLSRNLRRPELEDVVQENILGMGAGHVGEDMLLIIDPSDVSKKYAKKMEYLTTVRDGSAHDLRPGYWTLHIVGAEVDSDRLVPLYQRLWSHETPGFVSENEEVLRGVDAVMAHVGRRGIFVYDRGGNRINLFGPLLDRQARFLVRLVGNRHLVYNRETRLASDVAQTCPSRFATTIVRHEDGHERVYTLRFGFRRVRLPEREEPLYLLVIYGLGDEPLMLLTTEPLRQSYKCLWRMVRAYLKRWSTEETIRYLKDLLRPGKRSRPELTGGAKPHAPVARRDVLCGVRS